MIGFHLIKFAPFRGLLGEAPAASHDDRLVRSAFRAESAHAIDNQADHQNQAKSATADDGTAKVKSAAAEQKKKNK
jgi:hypothetical protein